jgi:hypothetical protein
MMKALRSLKLFSKEGLEIVHEHWNQITLEDPVAGDPPRTDPATNVPWEQIRDWNIEMLVKWEAKRSQDFQGDEGQTVWIVADELLFPLYPFDLSPSGDVKDLPPPRWPEEY